MLRVIQEVEPPRPSTKLSKSGTLPSVADVQHTDPQKLVSLMRDELDWIILKCLEKDRGQHRANGTSSARPRSLSVRLQRPLEGFVLGRNSIPVTTSYRLNFLANGTLPIRLWKVAPENAHRRLVSVEFQLGASSSVPTSAQRPR